MDGEVVGVARVEAGDVAVLRVPEGVPLRLDVLPIDGTGLPMLGVPVAAGVAVMVSIGAR